MTGYAALLLAVIGNTVANIALKRAMQDIGSGSRIQVLLGLLGSGFFWLGLISAGVLLVAYLVAIRTLPLGASYATVTALTIAILTSWGIFWGTEPADPVRMAGIGAIVIGFVLVTVSLGRT